MTAANPASKPIRPSVLATVRRAAKDWLDRPMTSWHLITAIFFLLLGFGLLMVLSASSIASYKDNGGSSFATFENQAVFAAIGLIGFVVAARISTRVLRTFSFPMVAVSILLLAAVLVVGRTVGGARSWISLGPVQFQPSEVAKLALLIWMGHVLAARRNTLRSLRALLIPVLPVFVCMVGLIMLEPDLGTTVSLGIVFIAVLWFAGAPWWMFATLSGGAIALVVYLANSAGYRSARVVAWLHPSTASDASTFQIKQSLYGLAHGHIFGAGLGQSISKTGWLPNADSDFIFAIIGEELGLIGAGLLLVLYGMLAYTGLRIARRNTDPFIKIVAAAATVWLVGQAAINVGYVVGLLPVTGIPLPMISRGGTSLVITMVVFGLLANFARREPQAAAALHSQGPGRMARFLGIGVTGPKPSKPRKAPKPAKARPERKVHPAAARSRKAGGGTPAREAGRRYSPSATAARRATGGVDRYDDERSDRTGGRRPAERRAAAAPVRSRTSEPRRRPAPEPQVRDFEGRAFVDRSPARRVDPRAGRRAEPARRDERGDGRRGRTVRP
ncbi:cell division-specific peptidoglycan biosynthesis regulator FtsW [Nakamurella panacisegetis]|uniref:Probable peptidoglycan glycosyltransferase FtsW n=1 Tax=Nakamurella panacisegetis TaxID=1090615 RepID=A0A1H0Q8Q2_9ACTN|nr:putative lipid II flippase FtsW [Nakamurella panacisegetis]SDP13727.1 cell division-specific peptidoglycan biosynthesis regulator FtsW [Nakamurella panacisegetis]